MVEVENNLSFEAIAIVNDIVSYLWNIYCNKTMLIPWFPLLISSYAKRYSLEFPLTSDHNETCEEEMSNIEFDV